MRQNRRDLKGTQFLQALGATVRMLRKRLGLTTIQLAERLADSTISIERLESGKRNVTVLHLAAIAQALEMSLPELLRRAERRLVRRTRPNKK